MSHGQGAPVGSSQRPRTRRDEQRERTRAELLDAAASVFAARGFNGASVDQVAEAAGFTKGAVYSNFDSKEELFVALLDLQLDRTLDALEGVLRDVAPEHRSHVASHWHAELPVLDGSWFLLEAEFLLYAARKDDPDIRQRVAARQQRTRASVTSILERHLADLGITEPAIPAVDIARLLMAAADGLAQASLVDETARDSDRLFGTLLELLQAAAAR